MRFETSVALRYLGASRRQAHVALISIVGLAVGVAALVVSLALLSGFQDRIRRQMMERTAHLRVSPARGARVEDPARVVRALSALPGALAVVPAIEGRGWASDADGMTTLPIRYRNGSPVPVADSSARFASNAVNHASYSCGRGLSDMPPSIATYVVAEVARLTTPTR